MIRKGLRPRIKAGIRQPGDEGGFYKVLPFKRSRVAIAVLAVFDIIFLIPAVMTFQEVATEWSKFDDLFDLVGAIFLTAWLLGWSIGPLLMSGILLLLLFGREVILVRPGVVEIFIGLPLGGITAVYKVSRMRNLRIEHPKKKSGRSWRGPHLAFDYGANIVALGSMLENGLAGELKSQIETAAGSRIRRGEALPEEVQGKWEPEKETLQAVPSALPITDAALAVAPVTLGSPSTLALIIANLVPIAGTIILGWKLGDVMVLYWAESAVIGIFNICKMAVIGRWLAILSGLFFIGHFGGFMAVHFLFIYAIFVEGIQNNTSGVGELGKVAQLFIDLWPALAALFASHAFSFYRNFIGRQEYRVRTIQTQMSEPYGRIIFMHLALIFGGGLTMVLGEPTPVLIIVIGAKIWFDVRAHLKERQAQ